MSVGFLDVSLFAVPVLAMFASVLLGAASPAQGAQAPKMKPCAILSPTVSTSAVQTVLGTTFTTAKKAAYQLTSISERNTTGHPTQCDFYATLKSKHGQTTHQMIWRIYPTYTGPTKNLHPNLILPGLFASEKNNTLIAVINGYGAFKEDSTVGHPTPSEAAALHALALRWAVSHRVVGTTPAAATSTTKP